MPDQKRRKKKILRIVKWLLALVVVGVVALVAWIYLVPMITADAVTVYDSYTVGTGDISTTKSFSASLSVKKSETFNASEQCTVKEIYVQSGDEVTEGDPLILLSTGELFSASFDGVVNEIRVDVGDWVWPRFSVVEICDLQHLEVSMNVDEYDIEELSLGQTCTVTVISLGKDFDTVIGHINRVSQATGSVAYYSVTCDLTVPENVLPGMQATVTMPADSVTDVTMVAEAALAFDEDKQPYVLIRQDDGTYTKNEVETGLSDGMNVEITAGLTPGQTVYAEAGTESVKAAVTLESLYQSIVGKTTVVNDMSSGRGGGGGMQQFGGMDGESGTMPQFGGTDGESGTMPQFGGTDAAGTDQTGTTPSAAQSAETAETDAASDTAASQPETTADTVAAQPETTAEPGTTTLPTAMDASGTSGDRPQPPGDGTSFGGMEPPSGAGPDDNTTVTTTVSPSTTPEEEGTNVE